jgi:hypothetical protein
MPPPPLTVLAAAAAQMHEMLLAYVAAGFSRAEGMQMICAVLAAMVPKGGQG